jgi:hypothetical protein
MRKLVRDWVRLLTEVIPLPEPLYASLPLTCSGTLTFKGDPFIRFEADDA